LKGANLCVIICAICHGFVTVMLCVNCHPLKRSRINANGPAIKVGCVTRRQHRAESPSFSREPVTVQEGYGALFAVQVQILWVIRVSRYNVDRVKVTSQGIRCLTAVTGTVVVQAIIDLSWVQVQKQKVWQATYLYCPC